MKKLPCEIIQDLLPLYVDNVCSLKSKLYIEEHLKECNDCRDFLSSLKGEIPMLKTEFNKEYFQENEIKFFRNLKKEIDKPKYMLIAIVLVMIVAVFGTFIFPKITTYPGYVRSSGKYLRAKNNTHILVGENGYRIMIPQKDDLFIDITDGDSIMIESEGSSLDSKNGETINAYECVKIFDGDVNDISELVIEELVELGYLDTRLYGD